MKSRLRLSEFYAQKNLAIQAGEDYRLSGRFPFFVLFNHLLKTRQAYDETIFAENEKKHKERLERRLRNQAQPLGFKLIPAAA